MTTPPPGWQPEPSDRPEPSYPPPGYPAQSYPAPDQPAGYQNYPGSADPYADPYSGGLAGDDPLVPRDFGGWFQRIVGVIKRSFPKLAVLAVLNSLVSAIFGVAIAATLPSPMTSGSGFPFDPSTGPTPEQAGLAMATGTFAILTVVGVLVSVVVGAFVQGASIFVIIRDASGRAAGVAEGLRFAAGRALPLIGWTVLAGLMFVVLAIPIVVAAVSGVAALIFAVVVLVMVAAVYLMIVLISLPGVVVVERDGLGRCFALIKNRWWATFGRLLVATVIGIVYYALVSFIAHAIGGGPNSAIAAIVQAVLLIPLTVATTAVIVVTYAELRSHQPDGAATGTLAAQLEG